MVIQATPRESTLLNRLYGLLAIITQYLTLPSRWTSDYMSLIRGELTAYNCKENQLKWVYPLTYCTGSI